MRLILLTTLLPAAALILCLPAYAEEGKPYDVAQAAAAECPPGAACTPSTAQQRRFCEQGQCGISKRRARNVRGFGNSRSKAQTSFGAGSSSRRNSVFKGTGVQGVTSKKRSTNRRRWRR